MFGWFRKKSPARDLQNVFQKLETLLSDDDMQVRVLGPQQYAQFRTFTAIDQYPNAEGEFGQTLDNPIPANGPIGSLSYLSNLTTKIGGHRILFHRVRSSDKIDAYEYVALSGDAWGFPIVDMYHSRKSRFIPAGFQKLPGAIQLTGFNHFWDDFPFGYVEQKELAPRDLRLLYAPVETIAKEMRGRDFRRPKIQQGVLQNILQA